MGPQQKLSHPPHSLGPMTHTDISQQQSSGEATDLVFDDPVSYLALFGLEAEIVFESAGILEAA